MLFSVVIEIEITQGSQSSPGDLTLILSDHKNTDSGSNDSKVESTFPHADHPWPLSDGKRRENGNFSCLLIP